MILPRGEKQAFESPSPGDGYYCKFCRAYTANFCPSFIRRRCRICRSCYKNHRSPESSAPVARLRRLLYLSLYNRGHTEFARGLTNEDIFRILAIQGVGISKVRRISPPRDVEALKNDAQYTVVKKS